MADKQKLVIVCTRGLDDERSSVAWSIANAGIASDMEVTVFLAAVGWPIARREPGLFADSRFIVFVICAGGEYKAQAYN